ncbi:MAG: dTDP-4-dehydrorhamnose 3,5-epimerase family protein [Candidatus Blackburnbacteria bacterium]|nr:dTDP-4-dehydrorhamnose 3,5-epimerase family protein [Candidatus Blackburnbacteria bacterium]
MDKRLVKPASINGLWIIDRPILSDERGFFREVFRLSELEEVIDKEFKVRQWSHSRSKPGVLRGLHAEPWNKLAYCVKGEVFVAIVDLRPDSETFGRHQTFEFGESNRKALFVSQGLAHGFYIKPTQGDKQAIEDGQAEYCYLVDQEYISGPHTALTWNDPDVRIPWPTKIPELSEKDKHNPTLRELFPEKFK